MTRKPPRFPLPRRGSFQQFANTSGAWNKVSLFWIRDETLLRFSKSFIVEVVFPVSSKGRSFDELEYFWRYRTLRHGLRIPHQNYTHYGYSLQMQLPDFLYRTADIAARNSCSKSLATEESFAAVSTAFCATGRG